MGTLFKRADAGGKGGKWQAEYIEANGKRRRRSTGTRDKRTAEQLLAAWELEVVKLRGGLADPHAERIREQQLRSIDLHLDEYIQSLTSAGRSDVHTTRTKNRINAIVDAAGWKSLRDCSAEKLEEFAVAMKKKGDAPRTIGHYIQAMRGFSKWALRNRRIPADPFWTVAKPNPESDRRLNRRMILPDEWPHLMAAITSPSYGVPPEVRRLLYEFAVQTALRSDEIRSRTVGKLDLSRPAVQVEGSATKNRQAAWLHITPGLAELLAEHCDGRAADDPLFTLCNATNMARMIRRDMAVARQSWIESTQDTDEQSKRAKSDFLAAENDAGQTLDFHSLRHTCGAWLAIRGVHVKTIQTIMRHSTITLTLDTYGHLMPSAEPDAVAKLEDIFRNPSPVSKNGSSDGANGGESRRAKANSQQVSESENSRANARKTRKTQQKGS